MTNRVFRMGQDRNEKNALTHTYEETEDGLFPMCGYGWNRSNGHSFSIFRGSLDTEGECRTCRKNVKLDKPAVRDGFKHKTKWL